MRHHRILTLAAIATLAAACGGASASSPDQVSVSGTATDTSRAAADEGAFPVTIELVHGTVELSEAPERVVSIGYVDHDPLLALGVTPVAVRDWFGDQPRATWPWAQDELGDAQPTVLPAGELDLEQVAALDPDLIVGIGF